MTAIPLQFQLDRPRSTVRLFGLTQAITANALALNVDFVEWDGVKASGEIIYNDRIPLPEQFTDPSPYQDYVNQWMTGAAAAALPLTLAQAQAVKSSLVDSIWAGKRDAAVTVVTSLGSYDFDTDSLGDLTSWVPSVAAIVAQINAINDAIVTMVTSFNTSLNTFDGDVNTRFDSINSMVSGLNTSLATFDSALGTEMGTLLSAINSWTSTLSSQLHGNWVYYDGVLSTTTPNQTQPTLSQSWSALTAPSESGSLTHVNAASGSYSGPSDMPTVTASIKMMPVGATAFPAFTVADLFLVINAIETQRNAKLVARNTKQAAVAALNRVVDCIAYDATTGW